MLEAVRDRALARGAVRAHVLDVRDEFARDYCPAGAAGRRSYDDRDRRRPRSARPLIAQKLVSRSPASSTRARSRTATARRHGRARRSLNATVALGDARLDDARRCRASIAAAGVDANLWGRSIDAASTIPGASRPSTSHADQAGRAARRSRRSSSSRFERGAPTAINGVAMPLVDLIDSLDIDRRRARRRPRRRWSRSERRPRRWLRGAGRDRLARTDCRAGVSRARALRQRQYLRMLVCTARGSRRCAQALDAFVDKIQERVTRRRPAEAVQGRLHRRSNASAATPAAPSIMPTLGRPMRPTAD